MGNINVLAPISHDETPEIKNSMPTLIQQRPQEIQNKNRGRGTTILIKIGGKNSSKSALFEIDVLIRIYCFLPVEDLARCSRFYFHLHVNDFYVEYVNYLIKYNVNV